MSEVNILQGDAVDKLKELAAVSVHCVISSPPYWGLRDYGVAGQLGLEKTPQEYIDKMVAVFREVKRVLRDDGTLWLNMGDSYVSTACSLRYLDAGGKDYNRLNSAEGATGNSERVRFGKAERQGLKPKDLCGIPWMLAFALRADGWYLRQDIIWHKPNPMPESCTDRCTKAHEYIFLLTKRPRYYYDAEAIREKGSGVSGGACFGKQSQDATGTGAQQRTYDRPDYAARNRRSVWTITTQPYPEAHFATFPIKLVEPCIMAGTSEKGCCPECGAPWERVVEKADPEGRLGQGYHDHENDLGRGQRGVFPGEGRPIISTTGWRPTCGCKDAKPGGQDAARTGLYPIPCTVLDPFFGAGTVGLVAQRLGRRYIGIELNPEYVALAEKRIIGDAPLFAEAQKGTDAETQETNQAAE